MSTAEQTALATIMADIMAIPSLKVAYPKMPIHIYATECEGLKETYLKDSAHFKKRNINTITLADKMDLAVAALREAEINWSEAVESKTTATNTWNGLQAEAYDLHDEAIASLEFIVDEDSDEYRQIQAIKEGTGNSDMILDLGKLSRLLNAFALELDAIVFDETMRARVEELYTILTDVYGKVTSDKTDANEEREIRDRVYAYCKDLEQQIKKTAKLVLRKEPELLQRYRSEYQYKLNQRKKNKEATL